MLADIHIKLEVEDIERLKKFCLHRGDLTFLISQAVKAYVEKLEKQTEREDIRLIHAIKVGEV